MKKLLLLLFPALLLGLTSCGDPSCPSGYRLYKDAAHAADLSSADVYVCFRPDDGKTPW